MELPCLATEQYPKGLGRTVPELGLEEHGVVPHLLEELRQQEETRAVILCGIEAHACIHHTTLDLLELGVEVHIPVDCVSSRSLVDRKFALERLRAAGAHLTTSEGIILGLAADSAHPRFKQLQRLVVEPAH